MVPKPLRYAALIILILLLIPPALIARARGRTSPLPRIHFVQDMDNMHRIKAQHASPMIDGVPLFNDGRGMRPPVPETVARGELFTDDHLHRGVSGGTWATTFPAQITVDMDFLHRGQDRFNIYCTPCHGMAGYGDGAVHVRAMELMNSPTTNNGTSWVAPKSVHEADIVSQPIGQTFNTVTNGARTMSGYAAQVPLEDRWAIVAYVKALQRSQTPRPGDVQNPERLPIIEVTVAAPDSEDESS